MKNLVKFKIIRNKLLFISVLIFIFSFFSCSMNSLLFEDLENEEESDIYYSDLTSISDWSEETHEKLSSDEISDNIDMIFDTSKVQKLRIVIESENWDLMNDDLDDLNMESDENPIFVPCDLYYSSDGTEENIKQWYKVGIRFKGNSSLFNANCNKLPFKLDFDEFEDEYEDLTNQRFYGFKQLNLKNNYKDESEMHEVVASELLRSFGLVSAHSSFYELYINTDGGDESDDIYYGLYTLVEEVDDTVIKTQYGDDNDSGNLYKPEDDAATFAQGTYDEDEYGLKTDEDESYEDVLALYTAINDKDSDNWKTNLEDIFDVDIFLKWLAANTVFQNWDVYGEMSHNYYIYNNPSSGKFEWIPWDNNEALTSNNRCLDLDMDEVSDDWPIIRYILDDPDYTVTYKQYVSDFATTLFNETYMDPIYEYYDELIDEYVDAEGYNYTFTSSREYMSAVDELIDHTTDRNTAALAYSSSNN